MKEIIKRPYVTHLSNKDVVESVLAGSLFSDWHDEVADKNSFFYRFSAALHSTIQDILREQILLFADFLYDRLDVTEGSYAINVDPTYTIALENIRFRVSSLNDHLIGDVYLMGQVIPDLGQEEQGAIDQLRILFGQGRFQVIDLDDINQIDTSTQRFEQIKAALGKGEVLLSGEQVAATNRGRIISFRADESPVLTGASVSSFEVLITGPYLLLDPLTIQETIIFADQEDQLVDASPENFLIGLFEASANYNEFYDTDKDGYISQEDIQELVAKIGVSIRDVDEVTWSKEYAKYDQGNKGIITQADINPALLVQGAVRETALVIRNPHQDAALFVRYDAYIEPYITYATPQRRVPGGTLGLTEILDQNLDIRIADGFATNSNDYVIGVNLSRNEIWFGRQLDIQFALRKISYPYQSNMHVKGMTFMDDVAFFVLQSVDGFLYKDLYSLALLRVDTLREVVEVSTDIIPIVGATIDPTETVTGCSITERKDRVRIFTDAGQIITVQLQRATLTLTPGGSPVASPDLLGEIPENRLLNNVKLFNGIDNYGFNVGIERYKFESNESMLERIKRRLSKPYLSGLSEISESVASKLGTWKPAIYSAKNFTLWNPIDPASPIVVEIRKVTNNSEAGFALAPFEKINTEVKQHQFLSGTVENLASETLTTSYYRNADGDLFEGKNLTLGLATMRRLTTLYIKTNPKSILSAPDLDEELVHAQSVPFRITYTTVDADQVVHADLEEDYFIDLPSLDSMKYYTRELEAIGSTEEKPQHLTSKSAARSISFYALHDRLTKYFFGDEYWNSIIEYIRSLDRTKWQQTEPGVSAYDEKYASGNTVRVSAFNQGAFLDRQIEVAL